MLCLALGIHLDVMWVFQVQAQDLERGKHLFANHCLACHQDLHQRNKKHRVTNAADLKKRVAAWALHMGGDWGKDEIDDVVLYLERTVYRFAQRKR